MSKDNIAVFTAEGRKIEPATAQPVGLLAELELFAFFRRRGIPFDAAREPRLGGMDKPAETGGASTAAKYYALGQMASDLPRPRGEGGGVKSSLDYHRT